MVRPKQTQTAKNKGQVCIGLDALPPQLLCEILTRLPIELILRCRTVCKSWNSLIQDPLFINLHVNQTYNQPSRVILNPIMHGVTEVNKHSLLLLDAEECRTRQIPDKSWWFGDLQIMSSCNGLLCMAPNNELGPVFVSNPITREFALLPSPATELSLLSHQVGLGFDSLDRKYKVVRAYTDKNRSQVNKFETITLDGNSWRTLTVPKTIGGCTIYGSVFWNGALHWKIKKNPGHECMLSFDLSNEEFKVIYFPDNVDVPDDFEVLELDGRLTVVGFCGTQMKIWRVTGSKVEGLSVCYEDMYDMYVQWNSSFNFKIIGGRIDDGYLLEVNAHLGNEEEDWKRHLTQFFPKMKQYLQLPVPGIPICFETVCFRPTLISPMQLRFVPIPQNYLLE